MPTLKQMGAIHRAPTSMQTPPSVDSHGAARVLRIALVVGFVAAAVMLGWMAWGAIARPDVGASLYGKGRAYTPVFWGPFIAFVAIGLGAVAFVFRRALHRLERGEDVYRPRRP